MSVLIASTHVDELLPFCNQLKNLGCTAQLTSDPNEFGDLVVDGDWKIVLMEIDFWTTQAVKHVIKQRHIDDIFKQKEATQLFFFSEKTGARTRMDAVRAGGRGFLTKPLDTSIILDLIDRHVPPTKKAHRHRILIIEDDEAQRTLLHMFFQSESFKVRTTHDLDCVLDTISEFMPDLILSDLYLGDYTGFELGKMLKQWEKSFQIPIIILSAEASPDVRRQVLQSGVDDYLQKPVNFQDLLAVVQGTIKRTKRYKQLIHQDSLTGLINHGQLFHQLRIESKRANRHDQPLSLVMIDLDDFKKINDLHGHLAGDEVLRQLAMLLKHRLRETDTAGRYGGEELAIILPNTCAGDAYDLVDDLRRAFEKMIFRSPKGTFHSTFSFGVTCWQDQQDLYVLWSQADETMYKAKTLGKNQGVVDDAFAHHTNT